MFAVKTYLIMLDDTVVFTGGAILGLGNKVAGPARVSLTSPVYFSGGGAVALAEFIAESRQIQRLDLRQNEVKVAGLMGLSLALRINRSLSSLDVDHIHPQEQVGASWTASPLCVQLV